LKLKIKMNESKYPKFSSFFNFSFLSGWCLFYLWSFFLLRRFWNLNWS